MLHALAHAGLARAAALEGDIEAARRYYEQMFALWRQADATAQPLLDARLEHSRLGVQRPAVAQNTVAPDRTR